MFSNLLTAAIVGGAGDDSLFGDIGDDLFHGDAGNDTIFGGAGDDTLIGGEGADNLNGGQGADVLYGEAGDDTLLYSHDPFAEQIDRLFGGAGSDTLILNMTSDFIGFIDIVLEIKAYALALEAGQDPGAGDEYVFATFGLRAEGFENVVLLIDGQQVDATLPPIPIALDDTATATDGGGVIAGSVSGNDNVPAGAFFQLISAPQLGEFSFNPDGSFEFDPLGDFATLGEGESQIVTATYSLTLQGQAPSTGELRITVDGVNDDPVGVDESFSLADGGTQTGVFDVTDIDGDTLTFRLETTATTGDFSFDQTGAYTYVAPLVAAVDVITVVAEDAFGGSDTFTLTFETTLGPSFLGPQAPIIFQTRQVDPTVTNSFDASTLFDLPGAGPYTFTSPNLRFGTELNATTGVLSGIPGNSSNGLFPSTIVVTDDQGRSASGEVVIAYIDSVITGDADDNNILGDAASNFIDGGAGNDFLQSPGGEGDVFQYTAGEGFDVIVDGAAGTGRLFDDHLALSGYTLDQLSFTRYGDSLTDLLITPIGLEHDFTEGVLVQDGLMHNTRARSSFRVTLDDGAVLTLADLQARVLAEEAARDLPEIIGLPSGPDTLTGGPGANRLNGLSGDDLYVFAPGHGADVVAEVNLDTSPFGPGGNGDAIQFAGRVLADATIKAPSGTADVIFDFGGGDSVRVEQGLSSNNSLQIESYIFDDQTLTAQQMRQFIVDQSTTPGDDVVFNPSLLTGAETIEGGAGDDTLIGSTGNDTYVYRPGDGFDVIRGQGNFGSQDFVEIHGFTLDIDPVTGAPTSTSQVQFSQNIPGVETFRILLDNGNPAERGAIDVFNGLVTGLNGDRFEGFTFVDQGLTLTGNEMRALLLAQQRTSGDDVIVGFNSAADTIEAGAGDDFVNGINGADTYIFRAGDDGLTIHDFSTAGTETLLLPDLTLAQLTFERDRSRNTEDLLIRNTVDAGDEINWRGLLLNRNSENDRIQDVNGDILTSADMRNVMLAQETADFIAAGEAGTIIGFNSHNDNFVSTPGLDAALFGGSGSDTYTVTTSDGRDTIRDTAISGSDTVVLQGVNVSDFDPQLQGPYQAFTNAFRTNDVTFFFDPDNRLTVHDFNGIENFVFDDATIAKADFVASFITPFAIQAPEIIGTGGGTVTGSTGGQEVFRVGNADTVSFVGGLIGDDIITIGVNGKYSVSIALDGRWAGANVSYDKSVLDLNDIVITIDNGVDPYETILIDGSFGSFEGGSKLLNLDISDDGVARATITGNEIYQLIVDQEVAAGEDRVFGSGKIGEIINAAPGDRFYQGGGGNDTYLYTVGDGRAIFDDGGFRTADTLNVTGYNLADATLRRDFGGDFGTIVIDFGADEIVLPGIFNLADGRVDFYTFDDEPVALDAVDLIQRFIDQENADLDAFTITGSNLADTLISAGDRHLLGGGGNDIYQITDPTGETWISESGFRTNDTVVLPVASTEVVFRQDSANRADLIIEFDAGGRVVIVGGYINNFFYTENFQFTDTTLTLGDVFSRVQLDSLAADIDHFNHSGADTLIGGIGDDALQGNAGANIYRYARGDGDDLFIDTGFRTFDVVEISGFQLSELNFETTETRGDSLRVTFDGAGGSITVSSFFFPGPFGSSIEVLRIVDDIDPATGDPRELNIDDVRKLIVEQQATAGDDRINGFFNVNDTLDAGGGGVDTLIGYTGDDTYIYTAGDGVVYVQDNGTTAGDTIMFNDVDVNAVTVRRLAALHPDLVFETGSAGDRVIVVNEDEAQAIDTYTFGQTTFTLSEVLAAADGSGSLAGGGPGAPLTGGVMLTQSGSTSLETDLSLVSIGEITIAGGGTTTGGVTTTTTTPPPEESTTPPAEETTPPVGEDTSFPQFDSPSLLAETSLSIELQDASNFLTASIVTSQNVPTAGDDLLSGTGGADAIEALAGDDTVSGGAGDDTLRGGGGNDRLSGDGGADRLIGGFGNDRLIGGWGADRLAGGVGADTLGGGAANDLLVGGGGADRLFGGGGNDRLLGGGWTDGLRGGAGDDTLIGGAGRDRLTGDAGADRFVFIANQGRDFVTDFAQSEDRIVMRAADSFGALDISTFQGDAIIRAGGTQFRLDGVDGDDLTAADFIFL